MNSITKQTYVTLPFSKINRFYVKHNQNFKLPAQSKQQPDIVGKKVGLYTSRIKLSSRSQAVMFL